MAKLAGPGTLEPLRLPWLEANVEFSRDRANIYMRAYEGNDANVVQHDISPPTSIKEAAARAPRKKATTTIVGAATGMAMGALSHWDNAPLTFCESVEWRCGTSTN